MAQADAGSAHRRSTATTQDSQMLAQRSPASSVRSHIQLQPTVVHINGAEEDGLDGEDEDDDAGSTTIRGGGSQHDDARRQGEHQQKRDSGPDGDDDDDWEQEENLTTINVGRGAWDDSDDDDDANGAHNRLLHSSAGRHARPGRAGARGLSHQTEHHSYINSLQPTSSVLRRWLVKLTKNPSAQSSLSAPHVTANLLSSSLNPAVLLSMPAYFDRTGVVLGIVGLVVVAALAGAGGGLWVVLGRYVGGSNIEAITAASFGRNTRWKGNIGRAVSGCLLAVYATGTAVIAYFALADLLLQVLFHYSPRGIPLHNRLFVTFVIGGIITTPLVIYPLAKRNLIRLSTTLAILFYPCTLAILLTHIYKQPPAQETRHPNPFPSLNPLHPPSIWAPYSLLPLLSLSASPLQIIAHNRSLRRTGISGSNVKAFLAAQGAQTVAAIGIAIAFGVGVGTQGMEKRLGVEIHPNLFTTLPLSDNLNLARILFICILSSHLALCLVTVRSAWSRLLFLFNLNPFRTEKRNEENGDHATEHHDAATSALNSSSSSRDIHPHGAVGFTSRAMRMKKTKTAIARRCTRPARDAIAGVFLWAITAVTAYWSGVGGIHLRKGQKNDPDDAVVQANFTRAQEVLGLLGAGVGFVLPALVWIILFHIRQPRAILPPFAAEMARQASAWFLGPQSVLAANKWRRRGNERRTDTADQAERQPLLNEEQEEEDEQRDSDAHPSAQAYRQSLEAAESSALNGDDDQGIESTPNWRTETQMKPGRSVAPHDASAHSSSSSHRQQQHSVPEADEATRILLARKERELQRRTRGRRVYQDIIVLAGILPLGISLIVLGALDLRHGGW